MLIVLTMRPRDLEPRLLNCVLQLSSSLQLFLPMIVHGGQGRLDTKWLQSIKDFLGDGAINSQTSE